MDDFQAEFDKAVQMDQEWRDHFAQTNLPMRQGPEAEERRQFMFDSLVAGTSLQETLLEQMRFSEMTEEQRRIGEMIIGNIDERGRLSESVDALSFSSGETLDKIKAVLKIIQTFHPAGVAARDLRECLMLQLERAGRDNTVEYRIVRDFMDALAKRKMPEIARGLELTVDEVQEAVERIACLEPHPGREFLPDDDRYILPEVFVTKGGRRLRGDHQQRADSPSAHQQPVQGSDVGGRDAGGAGIYPRKNPGGKIPDQEFAAAAADHPEHRQRDRQAPAGVHGKRTGFPQADDDGAGGGSGQGA